jgi:cytochrome P450
MSTEPVSWDPRREAYFVQGFEEISTVLRGSGWSSDPRNLPYAPQELLELPSTVLLFMDPPDHTRLRRLLSPAFTPRAIESLRPRVAGIVEAVLDGLDDEIDLLQEIGYLIPMAVIAELLDVGAEGAELFLEQTPALARLLEIDADAESIVASVTATTDLMMFLTPLLAERRQRPGDDFISALLTAPGGLEIDEIASTCILLLAAGHETTANLIANGALALLRDPGQLPHLLKDPERGVEELLRHEGPLKQAGRIALTDHELGGHRIEAGSPVYLRIQDANRSRGPLDLSREPIPHLAFGGGLHFCLGAALARLEAVETLTRLFDRFPDLSLRPGADPRWRESSTFHALEGLPVLLSGARPDPPRRETVIG